MLDLKAQLLFPRPHEIFPEVAGVEPAIHEALLAPLYRKGVAVGTVWALTHDRERVFDSEDWRVLISLSRFGGAAFQITESDRQAQAAQERTELINHELAHRIKNSLAVVIAIASQSLRGIADSGQVATFRARLVALSRAQDALLVKPSGGAPLQALAERVLEPLAPAGRLACEGPEIVLGERAMLSLSLILHELGTNARKYGAWSGTGGQVSLAWTRSGPMDKQELTVTWTEQGGPPVEAPSGTGFGTRLIERGLTGTGGADLRYLPSGLEMSMTAPLAQVSEDDFPPPPLERFRPVAQKRAAELEETPAFGEFTDPPAFWYPVRRDVAAALLASGDAAGAKAAAEASLKLRMKDPVAEALLARANQLAIEAERAGTLAAN